MKSTVLMAAVAFALGGPSVALAASKAPAAAAAAAVSADDVRALREQLQALSERLNKLEQSNQQLQQSNAALEASNAKLSKETREVVASTESQADAIAKTATKANSADWAGRIKINGDFRYRDEQIRRDLRSDQSRERLRARIGIAAKVNDTIAVNARLATGADDPRSTNQTLGAADTGMGRRTIGLDQYYATWKPVQGLAITGGKMPFPYWRPGQSLFNDSDINPEGLAVGYQQGIFFGNAFGFWMTERAAANYNPATGVTSAISTDKQGTIYAGLQLGLKIPLAEQTTLTTALQYTNLGAGKGRMPYWFSGGSIPQTTTATSSTCTVPNPLPAGGFTCTPTITLTSTNSITAITQAANGNSVDSAGGLLYDFKVTQLELQLDSKVAGLPVSVFADFAKNSGAKNGEDKALTAGFLIGKASDKNTWEFGYAYEKLEKDSYFGAFVDSDFGGGFTDTKGSIFRLGWAPAKNWSVNATYFLNKLNVSGLSNVALQSSSLHLQDESYKRLQLDFNVKY